MRAPVLPTRGLLAGTCWPRGRLSPTCTAPALSPATSPLTRIARRTCLRSNRSILQSRNPGIPPFQNARLTESTLTPSSAASSFTDNNPCPFLTHASFLVRALLGSDLNDNQCGMELG